jgi:(4-(4-[2-(gamma-L-glutamylamino)ethyl]phenoxymethyl)furan-2-yl)methanamine synthase
MRIAGFDVGGANTDVAVVDFDESGNINEILTDFIYFPMWQKKDELGYALNNILEPFGKVDAVGVSMTAELVDAYKTKVEGVLDISLKSENAFNVPVGFVGLDGIIKRHELVNEPMKAAAANWIATAPLAAKINPNSILIDTGSTTTDIIPIKNGLECATGRSDLERLKTGELVYSGTLRTNVVALIDKAPLNGTMARVASELFAVTGDVHMVLGNITETDYTSDTMDGAGKTVTDCMRRISRVVCGDLDVMTRDDIEKIAVYIYSEQVRKISEALLEVSERTGLEHVVTTGLGMDIIGSKASKAAGLKYTGMDRIIKKEDCIVAPAIGTAILMEQFLRKKSEN